MNNNRHVIDDLLAELRRAGPQPGAELVASITALGVEAVPALLALVIDPTAYDMSEDEEDVPSWAPYTAVQILGELHPPEALEPLLSLLTWDDYEELSTVLPEALAKFGHVALDPLAALLADQRQTAWTRNRAATALKNIADIYPSLRNEIVARLIAQLDTDEPHYEGLDILRGFLILHLVDLQASESINSIIRAFEQTWIDPHIVSWLDVLSMLDVPRGIAPHLDEMAPRRGLPLNWRGRAEISPFDQPAPPTSQVHDQGRPYHRQTSKVGRNEPCPCGSGKKFKKCHGR